MKITKNFELAEITANQRNIVNIPNAEQTVSICRLVFFLLQPLRIMLNKSITITSGFRCEKLNSLVGGTSKSQHVKGEAVDINVPGMSKKELFLFIIESELSFDQMIYEIDANCLHISYVSEEKNRNEKLIRVIANGVKSYYAYTPILLNSLVK